MRIPERLFGLLVRANTARLPTNRYWGKRQTMTLCRTLAVMCASLGLLVACKPTSATKLSGGRLFVISFQTLNNPFFVEVDHSLRLAIEAKGDRLITLDAQFNSMKQRDDIVDLLARNPTIVFINPVNWEAVKSTLVEVRRKNIPVIIVDAPVSDRGLVMCQVASDNFEAGRLACEALAQIRRSAKIGIIQHSVSKPSIDRVAGFKYAMARHPGMMVLDTEDGRGRTDGAHSAMTDLLSRFPNLDAVFAINDPSALGAISAIESAGRIEKITVVSVDGSKQGASAILHGSLYASVAQDAQEIGNLAAQKAYAFIAGQQVEKDVKVPVRLITRENAATLLEENSRGLIGGAENSKLVIGGE